MVCGGGQPPPEWIQSIPGGKKSFLGVLVMKLQNKTEAGCLYYLNTVCHADFLDALQTGWLCRCPSARCQPAVRGAPCACASLLPGSLICMVWVGRRTRASSEVKYQY